MSEFLAQYNEFMSKYNVFCEQHHCNEECPLNNFNVAFPSLTCIDSINMNPEKYILIVEDWYTKYWEEHKPRVLFLDWVARSVKYSDAKPWQQYTSGENCCVSDKCSQELPCNDCDWWENGIL